MASIYDDFRMNLKYYREKRALSQAELAIQADCSNGFIGNIEAGKVKPSFDSIEKLAAALSVHPADLFLRETSKSNATIRKELKEQINAIIDKIVVK
ncbi:MAG: helix-turn-helix transcriptional regulator [Spirochaetaceae bacterium]|nr:helix-turn-helix transcriptional regulator [Spirochaetaceae bacterium]